MPLFKSQMKASILNELKSGHLCRSLTGANSPSAKPANKQMPNDSATRKNKPEPCAFIARLLKLVFVANEKAEPRREIVRRKER